MGLSFHGGEGAPEGTCPREGDREGLWGDRLLSSSCQDEQGSQDAILFYFLAGDSETWFRIFLLEILFGGVVTVFRGKRRCWTRGAFGRVFAPFLFHLKY